MAESVELKERIARALADFATEAIQGCGLGGVYVRADARPVVRTASAIFSMISASPAPEGGEEEGGLGSASASGDACAVSFAAANHEAASSAAEAVSPKLTANEWAVLKVLGPDGHDLDWRAYPFRSIQVACGLDRRAVRLACRSLTRKGLAAFERGLMTEDGDFIGAGYRANGAGAHVYWNSLEGYLATPTTQEAGHAE